MKNKILIVSIFILILSLISCKKGLNIERDSKDLFPKMQKLEVYNGGETILSLTAPEDGYITINMSAVSNHNFAGHNFYLERYDVYIGKKYVTTIIDSNATAFKYVKKED